MIASPRAKAAADAAIQRMMADDLTTQLQPTGIPHSKTVEIITQIHANGRLYEIWSAINPLPDDR